MTAVDDELRVVIDESLSEAKRGRLPSWTEEYFKTLGIAILGNGVMGFVLSGIVYNEMLKQKLTHQGFTEAEVEIFISTLCTAAGLQMPESQTLERRQGPLLFPELASDLEGLVYVEGYGEAFQIVRVASGRPIANQKTISSGPYRETVVGFFNKVQRRIAKKHPEIISDVLGEKDGYDLHQLACLKIEQLLLIGEWGEKRVRRLMNFLEQVAEIAQSGRELSDQEY
jgi:hypothetical protein